MNKKKWQDAALEIYNNFANPGEDLFLSFIYDTEKTINFKNLVFWIGEYYQLRQDQKIACAPQIAYAALPLLESYFKKYDTKNLKAKVSFKQVYEAYFGDIEDI